MFLRSLLALTLASPAFASPQPPPDWLQLTDDAARYSASAGPTIRDPDFRASLTSYRAGVAMVGAGLLFGPIGVTWGLTDDSAAPFEVIGPATSIGLGLSGAGTLAFADTRLRSMLGEMGLKARRAPITLGHTLLISGALTQLSGTILLPEDQTAGLVTLSVGWSLQLGAVIAYGIQAGRYRRAALWGQDAQPAAASVLVLPWVSARGELGVTVSF